MVSKNVKETNLHGLQDLEGAKGVFSKDFMKILKNEFDARNLVFAGWMTVYVAKHKFCGQLWPNIIKEALLYWISGLKRKPELETRFISRPIIGRWSSTNS